jgi:hypothetical protein
MNEKSIQAAYDEWARRNPAEAAAELQKVADETASAALSVGELLTAARLSLSGSCEWDVQTPERGSGVYLITIDPLAVSLAALPETLLPRWNRGQEIVYIGRGVNLRRRLSQFYRHTVGHPRPHRGGEDILRVTARKTVFWVKTDQHADAERRLMESFKSRVGSMPFGNRIRSARLSKA